MMSTTNYAAAAEEFWALVSSHTPTRLMPEATKAALQMAEALLATCRRPTMPAPAITAELVNHERIESEPSSRSATVDENWEPTDLGDAL